MNRPSETERPCPFSRRNRPDPATFPWAIVIGNKKPSAVALFRRESTARDIANSLNVERGVRSYRVMRSTDELMR